MVETGRDFLLEIGTEEIPARFLDPALEELKVLARQIFEEKRLSYEYINTYGTPRRLVLYVKELAGIQKPLVKEVKGPAAKVAFDEQKKPTRAALGFAKSRGVNVENLIIKPVGPVNYVFAVIKEEGKPAQEVLPEICPSLITNLHFPKSMRWGNYEVRFARPIRWLLALYGEEVVPVSIAGVKADRKTYGHRFLSKEPLLINNPDDYFKKMKEDHVMIDSQQRKAVIIKQVKELAEREGGKVQINEELLNEVTNLVEYPVALTGSFDPDYLRLPPEVLITSMQEHQRYFPVYGPDGKLIARFVAISNTTNTEIIRSGNERVLRARLADAAFFWKEDLKVSLEDRVSDLKKVVWQESLGTVYEKVERLISLARYLTQELSVEEKIVLETLRAAFLAKADLTTSMVYEFPELQGVMGREYALKQGEDEEVARAIFDHYLPRFSGDKLPVSLPGIVLSIADRIDNLVGCFAIGIQPSGSQDPYALRRNALAVCNIILEKKLILSLKGMISKAYQGYKAKAEFKLSLEEVTKDLEEFFTQRLKGIFDESGIPYDTCEAVLSVGFDDIYGSLQRARALVEFRKDKDFDDLFTAFHRANNLSKKHRSLNVDVSLFEHPVEKALYQKLEHVKREVKESLIKRDYGKALTEMAELRKPVDDFFDGVMVMVDDEKIRDNRLGLLKNVTRLILKIADLSKLIEGN